MSAGDFTTAKIASVGSSYPNSVSAADAFSARLYGMGIGACFLTIFGGIWVTLSMVIMHWLGPLPVTILTVALVALLFMSGALIRRTASAARHATNSKARKRIGRSLGRINGIQWGLICAAYFLLRIGHHEAFLLPVIILIVGLHFFPLGIVFRYWLYHVTGIALVLWTAIYLGLLHWPPDSPEGAFGTGVILLVAAAITLTTAFGSDQWREQH